MQITKVDIRETTEEEALKVLKEKGWSAYEQVRKKMNLLTRIHVFLEGETIIQNLENRHQRPYTVYKKEILPSVLRQMGLPADTKARWSQKAGCSCGCSPAFIIEGNYGKTVYVTVE